VVRLENKDDTKELPLEEKIKVGYKGEFDQSQCKKKAYMKDYYLCREPEQGPICIYAIQLVSGKYVCPKKK
jgi:hypothetical protein